jgi:hypothetical protein
VIISKTDIANQFFDAIAATLSTRSVDAVLAEAVAGQTLMTSPLTVAVEQNGRLILLCRQTRDGCMTLEGVSWTNLDEGGWAASFPYSNIMGSAEHVFAQEIQDALYTISQRYYTYRIAYHGISKEQMVDQISCFLSH